MNAGRILMTALLLGTLFLVPADVTFAASAAAKVEAVDPVAAATVNLYCRMRVGKTIYATSGTGVFISEKGVILTNAHVAQDFLLAGADKRIDGWCSVRAGSPAKDLYTASVLYLPPNWVRDNADELAKGKPRGTGESDFALLYVTGMKDPKKSLPAKFPALPFDTLAYPDESAKVTVAAYPTEKLTFSQVRNKLPMVVASTTVSGLRSFSSQSVDVLNLAPSAAGSYGASGRPVVDSTGMVAGIVTSKASSENDRTLRAITVPYINRILSTQTGLSLHTLLAGNPTALSASINSALTADVIKIIANGLINKK